MSTRTPSHWAPTCDYHADVGGVNGCIGCERTEGPWWHPDLDVDASDPYLVVPNADAGKIQCPGCGENIDASDEDGMVCEGDYECPDCGEPYEVTDVVVRVTVSWRKQ